MAYKHKDNWTSLVSKFAVKSGLARTNQEVYANDISASAGFVERWQKSDGQSDIDMHGTDQFDHVMVAGDHYKPMRTPITFNLATSASETTQRFFVADQPYEIRGILLQYDTADGATNTATITKEVAGQAPGAGVSVMTNTFNLNTTANVVQAATLAPRTAAGIFGQNEAAIALNTGEMLSFNMANAVTSLAGVVITVFALPQQTLAPATYFMNANAGLATQYVYLANHPVTITGVQMVWSAAGTDAGTVTLDVTHEASTSAPGAGNSILAAAQSVKGAANTPVAPALTATASRLNLAAGDRLSVKYTGTLTALAGVVVVVSFTGADAEGGPVSIDFMQQVCFALSSNTSLGTNQGFFIADRNYEMYDVSMVWGTAGGGGNITVTIDGSTVASGGGTSILTDNTNAGPLQNGTANTPVVGTMAISKRTIFLPAGSRLSVKFAGTKGSLANVVVAASMKPL